MSLNPKCDMCQDNLDDFWAILLSPPKWNDVEKFHICTDCYTKIMTKHKIKY